MKVKRFFAKTMQEALRSVKEQMGADAVILSNKKVDGGVEIVTAVNYDEELVKSRWQRTENTSQPLSSGQLAQKQAEHQIRLEDEMKRARERIERVRHPQKASSQHTTADPRQADRLAVSSTPAQSHHNENNKNVDSAELAQMKAEILQLKSLLEQQQEAEGRGLSLVQQQLRDQLSDIGVDSILSKRILHQVDASLDVQSAMGQAMTALTKTLSIQEQELIHTGGIHALVGPTGSGKTTTIGKLAARYVLEYDASSIALVTTDRYRVAAHEQLKVFGRILNIPVAVVDEQNSLTTILDSLEDKKLVLIDTAGLNHQDAYWMEQMQELMQVRRPIKRYLVIPATTQPRIMTSNYHHYKKVGISACCLTKLDEAVTLGESLSFLARTGLSVAYVTDGQKIPDDIHAVSAQNLVNRALSLQESFDGQYPPTHQAHSADIHIDIA